MAEYLAAEVIGKHDLITPLTWIEHYPEHAGGVGGMVVGEILKLGADGGMPRRGEAPPDRAASMVVAQARAIEGLARRGIV
jgi:hypothetical protein